MDIVWQFLAEVRSWFQFDIYALISTHGPWFYPITFVWTFLEGETFVIFAGAAASQKLISIWALVGFAWLGSFCGDQFYFLVGRRFGFRILQRFPRWQPGVDASLKLLHKYHVGFILTFRFIYGVRNFSSFAMGMSPLPWSRFLMLNFFAAGLWAVTFAGAGYALGTAFAAVLDDIAQDFGLIMLGLFAVVFGTMFYLHRRGKQNVKRSAQRDRDAAHAAAVAQVAELPIPRAAALQPVPAAVTKRLPPEHAASR